MDAHERAELRAILRARLDAVRERLRADEDALRELAGARSDATADDEHDPEGSTLSDEWSRLEGLRAEALRERERIESAIARLGAGDFGLCATCGRAIPVERLRIRPTATQCVACAGLSSRRR